MKCVDVAIAIVRRDDHVLVCRRPDSGLLAGYWEFPGGKLEPGESLDQCVARELMEEVCVTARAVAALPPIEHQYPEIHVRLHPYLCEYTSGEPRPVACSEVRWVRPDELPLYRFPPANDHLLEQVRRRFCASHPTDATPPILPTSPPG